MITDQRGTEAIDCRVRQGLCSEGPLRIAESNNLSNYVSRLKSFLKKDLLDTFLSSRHVVFYGDCLGFAAKLRILGRFERFPIGYTSSFKMRAEPWPKINEEFRMKSLGETATGFDAFFNDNVLKLLPVSFVENYEALSITARSITQKGRFIFTSGAHLFNDLFKVWSAQMTALNGRVLIHSPHGGAIPHKYVDFDHHRNIQVRAKWSDNISSNEVRVFPGILFSQRKCKGGVPIDKLTLIGYEGALYIVRPENAPWSSLTLIEHERHLSFIAGLSEMPRAALNIRPYPNRGWNHAESFVTRCGDAFISRESDIIKDICRSRMIVCTYPQTTYTQAMESGRPTILCFNRDFWDFEQPYEAELMQFYEGGLIFDDPQLAAAHVNNYWSRVDEWWGSVETQALRTRFREMFCYTRSDPIETYIKAFDRAIDIVASK